MSHAKTQHTVPQSYLRRFTKKHNKGDFLWCFDKTNGKRSNRPVSRVAYGGFFYDFEFTDGERYTLEPSLAKSEDKAKRVIDDILDAGSIEAMPKPSKAILADFVALQMFRCPANREGLRQYNQLLAASGVIPNHPLWNENQLKTEHVALLTHPTVYIAKVFLQMRWALCHNGTGIPLWTSDSPVWRYNSIKNRHWNNTGIFCQGIEIHQPLSPKYLLVLCDPSSFPDLAANLEMNEEHVLFENRHQVIYSARYVFSPEDDFELADCLLEEHPEYGNPNRPQFNGIWYPVPDTPE